MTLSRLTKDFSDLVCLSCHQSTSRGSVESKVLDPSSGGEIQTAAQVRAILDLTKNFPCHVRSFLYCFAKKWHCRTLTNLNFKVI